MSERIRDNKVKSLNNIHQDEHQDSADAKRVILVDEDGNIINDSNPLPTSASFTGDLDLSLTPQTSGVHIGDKTTGDDAQVDASRRLRVHDADAKLVLDAIAASLAGVAQDASVQDVVAALVDILNQLNTSVEIRQLQAATDNVLIAGTENGLANGTLRYFVNNLRQQILASHDRNRAFVWADFGTKTERVTEMNFTSPTFPGVTAKKLFTYTPVGSKYRLDSETWSIII